MKILKKLRIFLFPNVYYNMKKTYGCFELNGYEIDYFQDGRYLGSIRIEEPDRDTCGYQSRRYEIADRDIKFKKNKVIKKGTRYYTELIPICGKVVGNIFEIRKPTKYEPKK